jgi:hypothetical protein
MLLFSHRECEPMIYYQIHTFTSSLILVHASSDVIFFRAFVGCAIYFTFIINHIKVGPTFTLYITIRVTGRSYS